MNKIILRNIYSCIEEASDVEIQKMLWLNQNNRTPFVSSFIELYNSIVYDFKIGNLIEKGEVEYGLSKDLIFELVKFINLLIKYEEKDFDQDVIKDPEWLKVVRQARKVLDIWSKDKPIIHTKKEVLEYTFSNVKLTEVYLNIKRISTISFDDKLTLKNVVKTAYPVFIDAYDFLIHDFDLFNFIESNAKTTGFSREIVVALFDFVSLLKKINPEVNEKYMENSYFLKLIKQANLIIRLWETDLFFKLKTRDKSE